jgi:anti-anti-sigma regulatory factor
LKHLTLGRLEVDIDDVGVGDAREQRVVLRGRLDEEARLGALVDQVPGPRLVLDTAAIPFINSIGVREWIHLLYALRQRGTWVILERVSEPLTAQLSMVLASREGVEVRSVYVPYECARCLREENVLIDVGAHRAALIAMRPPTHPCPECGGTMELADLPERYFLFVRDVASGS